MAAISVREKMLFLWTSCQVQSPEMSITRLEPYTGPHSFSQQTQNGQIPLLNVYQSGPYGKLLATQLVSVNVFEY